MYRVDPKQAVLEHVSKQATAGGPGRALSEQAESIIAAPVERSISGAVVVGVAQVVEALLLAALGYGIYASYVVGGQPALDVPVILASCLLANVLFTPVTNFMWGVEGGWIQRENNSDGFTSDNLHIQVSAKYNFGFSTGPSR